MEDTVNNIILRSQATLLVRCLLDGAEMDKPQRVLPVIPDPTHDGFVQIPLFDVPNKRMVHLFLPKTNPRSEMKQELQQLVRSRKGYYLLDLFQTPWGNFLVTDGYKIKEV